MLYYAFIINAIIAANDMFTYSQLVKLFTAKNYFIILFFLFSFRKLFDNIVTFMLTFSAVSYYRNQLFIRVNLYV